ncbi:MAG: GNAT family N-acetyltransferase [Bacilli bacterium]|nr:GNAT family N-acetyltransferase [Bacilli bacterium]MBN2876079.1 GNAT family N-acetyltransferase [Bacilli bacterium]
MIEKAKESDLTRIVEIAVTARTKMLREGLFQWPGDYPNRVNFLSDLNQNALYIYKEDNTVLGSISLLEDKEVAYREITWKKESSLVIHRIIVDPMTQGKGIGMKLFEFSIDLARKLGYDSVKVDTHPDNLKMQGLIKKAGFIPVGYLKGINRLAYEFVL